MPTKIIKWACSICGTEFLKKEDAEKCEANEELRMRCFNPETKQILCKNHDVCLRIKMYGHSEQYVCMEHKSFKKGSKPQYYTGDW